ncbi:cobaltochelatase subunit CobN [uncultured Methanomethylovorans sp.]|uniref:cobaltochelatase subunit CobN n=1 Tax=uncultured Methanomethylovorans sp. TaxID=183759 RepID=UPI002AA6DC5A|nr:cobaltochelatase subunit CobN [uncultured Methanomethylovorans sp.]
MKITAAVWGSDCPLLAEAAEMEGVELSLTATHEIKDPEVQAKFFAAQQDADILLLHPSMDAVWDEIIPQLRNDIPLISFGYNQDFWTLSTVPTRTVAIVSSYMTNGGKENFRRMVRYLISISEKKNEDPEPPVLLPWEGIYHPEHQGPFTDLASYRTCHPRKHSDLVGIVFSRTYWANGDLKVVDALIRRIEEFADATAIFCLSHGDTELGARPGLQVTKEWLAGEAGVVLNLQPIFKTPESDKFSDLDAPIMHPLLLYHRSKQQWLDSPLGPSSVEIGWSIALPEMQGMTEMLPVGSEETNAGEIGVHEPIEERIERIARRTQAWLRLRSKKPSERKVAFILHNKPCSSVEATVGAGAHLDTLESTARVLNAMKNEGYSIEPPANGKELIDRIMEKRAISDFRWTSVGSIVRSGGALAQISENEYCEWFRELDTSVQSAMESTWGRPPGEEMDGVPAAMVHEGRIVVTGVTYGNALVCVQPKRGCAGSRCDGQACKILHDPQIPPTHQYIATYRWLERVFGADVIVHVGTHGTLEFLPGKSAAPSDRCYPDIAIGTIPHLYIYNSDNPPEGTVAKRRAAATLVDHMQTVMQASGLYGDLKELDNLLEEYARAKDSDPARTHKLEHIIIDSIQDAGIADDTDLADLKDKKIAFPQFAESVHRALTRIESSRIPNGMHIFGEQPAGDDRLLFIHSAARFDNAISDALFGKDAYHDETTISLREREQAEIVFVREILAGYSWDEAVFKACGRPPLPGTVEPLKEVSSLVLALNCGIEDSKEMESLLHGFSGGFIEPGPSGLITRGRPDILPTGRNFYSLDPATVPTKAAWMVGCRLADVLLDTYLKEHGKYPESVAMYWMASDLMWAGWRAIRPDAHAHRC